MGHLGKKNNNHSNSVNVTITAIQPRKSSPTENAKRNLRELFDCTLGWIAFKDIAFVILLTIIFICFQLPQLHPYKTSFNHALCLIWGIVTPILYLLSSSEHRDKRLLGSGWFVLCFTMFMNDKFVESLNSTQLDPNTPPFPFPIVIFLLMIFIFSLFRDKEKEN